MPDMLSYAEGETIVMEMLGCPYDFTNMLNKFKVWNCGLCREPITDKMYYDVIVVVVCERCFRMRNEKP